MDKQARRAPLRKVDFSVFIIHWVVVAAVCVSAATGWRIAVDDSYSAVGNYISFAQAALPKGGVHLWHIISGFIITAAATAYGFLLAATGGARRVTAPIGLRKHYLSTSGIADFLSSRVTWRILRVKTYQVAFVLIALMLVTGWMLYFDAPIGGRKLIATVHGIASVLFLVYTFAHLAVQLKAGVFKSIFLPRFGKLGVGLSVLGVVAVAFVVIYASRETTVPTLEVPYTEQPPALDGKDDDPAWRGAQPFKVQAFDGENAARDVSVEVRAVRDEQNIYFLFKWTDPTLSRKYMPLIKTEGGWRVLQSGFDRNDETELYEDKFAILFSRKSTAGSGTAHLGPGMRPGAHRDVTRGLHYTEDGSIVDVWHWKATRTAPMQPGMMDDNYFGPPMSSEDPGARYTGGYTQDPLTEGGYTLNWEKVDPAVSLNEGYVLPKFLPTDPEVARNATRAHQSEEKPDRPYWHMHKADVVEYSPELDNYETGTVLPGVVIRGPFAGDRGDVLAEASWDAGVWTLEATRRLKTGSEYDVDFTLDEDIYFWVATFDNSQIRHSYHIRPGKLKLGE